MNTYLSNAFSLNMMNTNTMALIKMRPIRPEEIPADVESIIGHEDTAKVVSRILKRFIPSVRVSVQLDECDVLYLAQYKGPRLPEGSTTLPEGATIQFLEVTFREGCGNCQSDNCDMCGLTHWIQV